MKITMKKCFGNWAAVLTLAVSLLIIGVLRACSSSAESSGAADKTYTVDGIDFTMKGIAEVTDGIVGHEDEGVVNYKAHKVSISAYLIGATEVTQELWQAVMGTNPSFFDNTGDKVFLSITFDTKPAAGEEQTKRPVENINWFQSIAFCNELTKKVNGGSDMECVYTVEGHTYGITDAAAQKIPDMNMKKKGFRLPTNAEWEWAAKGGTDDKWAGTNDRNTLKNYAWYSNDYGGDSYKKTHEVKKKLPNGYGLYDMSGNVWEWCWDWYNPLLSPMIPPDYTGPDSGTERVIYSGSFYNDANGVKRTLWIGIAPNFMTITHGLRIVSRP